MRSKPETGYNKKMVKQDSFSEMKGVLLSKDIEHYVKEFKLIHPFNPDNLKPASYDLTLGPECAVGGKIKKLVDDPDHRYLEISPHQVAIISTAEEINMPAFLIGRWSLRIKWVYEGLVWVGGPQVDPGYCGRLFCPVYNFSNREITLELGETIATIDFVKTTPFGKNCKEYSRPPPRKSIEDYNYKLESAPLELRERTEAARRMIERLQDRVDRFQTTTFTVLGILIAALAIISSASYLKVELASFVLLAVLLIAIGALVIAFFAVMRANRN